jgi:hypothetical protein
MQTVKFYEKEVDRLFKQLHAPPGTNCQWPVFGGGFMKGEDDESEMRQTLCNALRARDWFAENGPADAPPLPLNPDDRNKIRFRGGIEGIVGYYARSLDGFRWDYERHPSFYDFACGLMALNLRWANEELRRRFPPRPLEGLNPSSLAWSAPERQLARLH